eukprot:SAG31_NODE_4864_length_2900_cov_1.249554_2_plen_110_part_00
MRTSGLSTGKGCCFLVFVQLFEKYGTLIERNAALIEKVAPCSLWRRGSPPDDAGNSCAQPGGAVNFTGISTFTPLRLCPLLPAPPHKGEREKGAPEPGTVSCIPPPYVS